jgi:hypothetical protein
VKEKLPDGDRAKLALGAILGEADRVLLPRFFEQIAGFPMGQVLRAKLWAGRCKKMHIFSVTRPTMWR